MSTRAVNGSSSVGLMWRAVQVAAAVLVIGLAARALAQNWQAFRVQPVSWSVSPGWLGLSLLAVLVSYAVLIEAWRRVVVGLGETLAFIPAARIWLVASLGKYLPGKLWAVAGAAVLAKRAGVNPLSAVSGALLLQAMAVSSGLFVAAVTVRAAAEGLGNSTRVVAGMMALVALAATIGLAWPRAVAVLRRLAPGALKDIRPIPSGALLVAFGANIVAWFAYGIAFYCLTRGLIAEQTASVSQSIGVFSGAYVIGLVTLFAPGGIGPRESIIVLLLLEPVGARIAVALAIASRLELTFTEIGCAVPFLFKRR